MRYLVTGHTGFKGYWLSVLLSELGHEVVGLALDPVEGSLYDLCSDYSLFAEDLRLDIRNKSELVDTVKDLSPDFVFHLAAQPLVSESYLDPIGTVEANVNGTLNLLSATRELKSLLGQVIVTTDKVYKNVGSFVGYQEGDALGGDDIYSASKAAADIVTQAFTTSFECAPTAIARSGNVIGGGDHGRERLLPDVIRSLSGNSPLVVRSPESIRPWQHVLDCLWGYYLLSENVIKSPTQHRPNSIWNFGPDPEGFITVGEIVSYAQSISSGGMVVEKLSSSPFAESLVLTLDSDKAKLKLGWGDNLKYPESVDWTLGWHSRVSAGEKPGSVTKSQISEYLQRVKKNPLLLD